TVAAPSSTISLSAPSAQPRRATTWSPLGSQANASRPSATARSFRSATRRPRPAGRKTDALTSWSSVEPRTLLAMHRQDRSAHTLLTLRCVVALGMAAIAAGCASEGDLSALQREQRTLARRLADTRADIESLRGAVNRMQGKLEDLGYSRSA